MLNKHLWLLVLLGCMILISACGAQPQQSQPASRPDYTQSNTLNIAPRPVQPLQMAIKGPPASSPTPRPTATPHALLQSSTISIPNTGIGDAPYGSPPALTAEEIQLTQQLFALINSDRAARGLYAYSWNATLSGGARLHSWNMYHCGFSHTCPDGISQCQRIANEGFASYQYCGENIAYAGPYPTAWAGVDTIQESMVNEPATGFHRIHLLSTTLRLVGVGLYVDPTGYIWFTEDFVG